jgi:phosphatidylinositol alpha 1,6-mannosyltransferase
MKIAHFIGTLRKESEDGVARVLLALVREAQRRAIQSMIITGWAQDRGESPVSVIEVPSITLPFYKAYKVPLPGMAAFKEELDRFNSQVIHVHSPDIIAWSALKYARKRQIPIVDTYHTNFSQYLSYYHIGFLRPLLWFVLKRLYRKMDIVTTPSAVATEELAGRGITARTIPWGVDLDVFSPSFRSNQFRSDISRGKEKKIILCVSRLTWEKDVRTVAETYNLLKENRDDFVLVMAGDGPDRAALESMMTGAVFLGFIHGEQLSTAYASSDVLLFVSSTETFGNVTAEAMASGIVPVVADAGGSRTLVSDGKTGLLARPKDADDFYRKICLLLEDERLRQRMRANVLAFAKNLTWEKTFDTLLGMYASLMDRT